jgi:hypothetical protein
VERAHALEDGGGRELAYVKMSRATQRSTVYVVADSAEQAAEDLVREWKVERRLTWAIDRSPAPGRDPATRDLDAVLRRGQLLAERHAVVGALPDDPSADIRTAERELDRLRRRRAELETGRGSYANHPLNGAVLDFQQAQANVTRLQGNLDGRRLPRRERREKEGELARWRARLAGSARTVEDIHTPEAARIDGAEAKLTARLAGLHERQQQRVDWFAAHPEAARRLDRLDGEIHALDRVVEGQARGTDLGRGPMRDRPWLREVPVTGRSLEIGIER